MATVVASWTALQNRRLQRERAVEFPLQVVIQYPIQTLPALFREIVHGELPRKYPPFGIPVLNHNHRWDGRSWQGNTRPIFESMGNVGVPGEGCMLWHQGHPWRHRGHTSHRFTNAILKFKPIFLATAYVGALRVEHSQHRQHMRIGPVGGDDEEDDGATTGFHVHLRTLLMGKEQELKAFAPASFSLEQVQEHFKVGSRVFYTFFMFERMPMYPRALGRTLSIDAARRVQRGCLEDPPLPLEKIMLAQEWTTTQCRAMFPSDCKWDTMVYLQRARALRSQRILASDLISTGDVHTAVSTLERRRRDDVRRESENAKRRKTDHLAILHRYFDRYTKRKPVVANRGPWAQNRTLITRYLLCLCLWVGQFWWTAPQESLQLQDSVLPIAWGPLSIDGPNPNSSSSDVTRDVEVWIRGMFRVALVLIAGAWQRQAPILQGEQWWRYFSGSGVSEQDLREMIDNLERRLQSYVLVEAMPHWNASNMVSVFQPVHSRYSGMIRAEQDDSERITMETVLRFIHEKCGGADNGPSVEDVLHRIVDAHRSPVIEHKSVVLSTHEFAGTWFLHSSQIAHIARRLGADLHQARWARRQDGDVDDSVRVNPITALPFLQDRVAMDAPRVVMGKVERDSGFDDTKALVYHIIKR